jgi:hypothetical protein
VPLGRGTIVGSAGHARPVDEAASSMKVRIDGERVRISLPPEAHRHPSMPSEVEGRLKDDGSFRIVKRHQDHGGRTLVEVEMVVEGQITGSKIKAGFNHKVVTTPQHGAYDTRTHWGTGDARLTDLGNRPSASDGDAAPALAPPGRGSVDRTMRDELVEAAASGQGITKAELKKIIVKHSNDGPKGLLTITERRALQQAVDQGQFARSGTAGIAEKIASGAGISLLDARSVSSSSATPTTSRTTPAQRELDPYFWGSMNDITASWIAGGRPFPRNIQDKLRQIAMRGRSTDLNERVRELAAELAADPDTRHIRVALQRRESTGYYTFGSQRLRGDTSVNYQMAFADTGGRRFAHNHTYTTERGHGPSGFVHD